MLFPLRSNHGLPMWRKSRYKRTYHCCFERYIEVGTSSIYGLKITVSL